MPELNVAVHVVPQLIPAGLLIMLPEPVPEGVTVRVYELAKTLKVAVTETLALRVIVHDAVPVHAPDHPPNVEPAAGVAVKVTFEPLLKLALHVVPQLIPAGLLVTVPLPVPARVTLKTG